MANITPDYIRGFIAPLRLTADHWWQSQSSMTQNGELAGVPTSADSPSLTITAKGTQTQTVEIETRRAGHIQDNAGFVWRYEGDTDYYGAEPPNKITDVLSFESVGVNEQYIPRHAIRTTSGVILVAIEHTTVTQNIIEVSSLTADGTYNNVTISTVDSSTLSAEKRFGTLCELPDGSVMLYFYAINEFKEVANVVGYRSTDDGATWDLVSSKCLSADLDISSTFGSGNTGVELQQLRAAASASQVLLFASYNLHNTNTGTVVNASRVSQYVSTNRGLSFLYVDASSDADGSHFYLPDIVEYNGVFIISYFDSVDSLSFTRIANAGDSVFDLLTADPAFTLSGGFANTNVNRLVDGDKTFYLDTDGRLYVYVMRTGKTQLMGAYNDLADQSISKYATDWKLWSNPAISNLNNSIVIDTTSPAASGGGIKNIIGVPSQGEQLLFCNWANVGTNGQANGLQGILLGMWTTQQYPRLMPYPEDNQWAYNLQDWIPFDQPEQNSVWTRTVAGSPSAVLGGDHITLTCAGSQTIEYSNTVSDKTNGCIIHCRVSNISGSQTNAGVAFGVQIREQTTTDTYNARVLITDNDVLLFDDHASTVTPVASITNINVQDGIAILFHIDNKTGDTHVYATDSGSPRQFESITHRMSTDPATTQKIYWGIPSYFSLVVDREVDWHFFSYGLGDSNGLDWQDGDVNARAYSGRGFDTQIKEGLTISTLDGAAREGDAYIIEPQYGSPITRTLHSVSPSPQIGWRSDAVANPDTTAVPAQTIAWMIDTTLQGTADTHMPTEAIGLHLTGINFAQFEVQKYTSGVWSSVATVNNYFAGNTFSFTRLGAAVVSTATNNQYLQLNECAGWSVLLDDGAGNVVQRKIISNGDGVLSLGSTKKAYLHLEGVQSSDPNSGTATLIPSACTVVLDVNELAGLRIVITSQKTAEGYFTIGTMVLGSVVITSPQYGRGRTVAFEANVLENITPSGTLYAQKRGNGGRVVRVSWTDGVDTSALNEQQADPDYYQLYTAKTIAAQGSVPYTMRGLVQYLSGSRDAVVYLPSIETSPSSSYLIYNRYHNHMLCTLGNDTQMEHVIGDELIANNQGEVFRVGTVILREVR